MRRSLLIWGIHPVEEALRTRPDKIVKVETLPSFGRKKNQKALLVRLQGQGLRPEGRADFHSHRLPKGAVHQGICAEVEVFWEESVEGLASLAADTGRPVVACDQIEDPQNLGAVIRTAVAFEAAGILIPEKQNAPVNGTVVKASSGALFHTKVCTGKLIEAMEVFRRRGIHVVCLDARGNIPIHRLDANGPVCIVLGSESKGIRKNIRRLADFICFIPINPVLDSLNVSNAATAALYELRRRRLTDR